MILIACVKSEIMAGCAPKQAERHPCTTFWYPTDVRAATRCKWQCAYSTLSMPVATQVIGIKCPLPSLSCNNRNPRDVRRTVPRFQSLRGEASGHLANEGERLAKAEARAAHKE